MEINELGFEKFKRISIFDKISQNVQHTDENTTRDF